jgi:hypothetical protein
MTDARKYLTAAGALAFLAVSTAMAQQSQQAPTVTPPTTQPNGAATPQVPRDMGPATPDETTREGGEATPETAQDTTPVTPETARDTTPVTPETARDISDTGPETARDISESGPETARDTRVATSEGSAAADVRTSETDRDRGVVAPVTGREDPNAPGNNPPPGPNAVRSIAQLQQDSRAGCWVKLFDAPNFAGADVTLVGAASMRALDGTFRSIEVGPTATVVTYRAENFGGSIQRLDPGLKVPENTQEFGSLRISCPNVSNRTTPSRG